MGEAVERVCKPNGLRRINYEVLGNLLPVLHAHVVPRYEWEHPEFVTREFGRYPKEVREAPEHAYSDEAHGELRAAITTELNDLMRQAYD